MNLGLSRRLTHKLRPVTSAENLRRRVERLLLSHPKHAEDEGQLSLGLQETFRREEAIRMPTTSITAFLQFLTDSLPDGDVYLFGGVLRDLALLGGRGFNSDIDIVVEGDWQSCVRYLDRTGARRNKFGGYRLRVAGWDVDIWSAKETWAIRQGIVPYKGIASLTETTVLNWDAVLMNWRTRAFVFRNRYLDEIQARLLDIVLDQNPDPMGMAVRVFRHLCLKDAKSVTEKALEYLADCTSAYTLADLTAREVRSYGKSIIEPAIYRYFEHVKANKGLPMGERISLATQITRKELGEFPLLTA